MNRLVTYTGKMPVYLGDVDFLQDSVGAAFTLIARACANSGKNPLNAILQGVEISQPSAGIVQYSSGVVVLNGEILPINGASISVLGTEDLYFHVISVLDGERTFGDGQTHKCHESRTAIINTTSTDGILVSDVQRMYHIPEDLEYDDVSGSGNIRQATLRRRKGQWVFRCGLDVDPGTQSVAASVSFNVPAKYIDDIPMSSVACILPVNGESIYAFAMCGVAKDYENNRVTVTISNATQITLSEGGIINVNVNL